MTNQEKPPASLDKRKTTPGGTLRGGLKGGGAWTRDYCCEILRGAVLLTHRGYAPATRERDNASIKNTDFREWFRASVFPEKKLRAGS